MIILKKAVRSCLNSLTQYSSDWNGYTSQGDRWCVRDDMFIVKVSYLHLLNAEYLQILYPRFPLRNPGFKYFNFSLVLRICVKGPVTSSHFSWKYKAISQFLTISNLYHIVQGIYWNIFCSSELKMRLFNKYYENKIL